MPRVVARPETPDLFASPPPAPPAAAARDLPSKRTRKKPALSLPVAPADPHAVGYVKSGRQGGPTVGSDHHVSQLHPEGRIVVHADSIAPAFRPHPDFRGYVDLTPLRGRRIPMRLAGIQRILRYTSGQAKLLVEQKVIEACHTVDGEPGFFLFDPAWTGQAVYERWMPRVPRPRCHADYASHKAVRRILRIDPEFPNPDVIRQGMLEMLAEMGSTAQSEINAFVEIGVNNVEQCAAIRSELRNGWRRRGADAIPLVSMQDVRGLHPAFSHVPGTCLDRVFGGEHAPPSANLIGRAWRLQRLRLPAVLELVRTAANYSRQEQQLGLIDVFEHMDAAFVQIFPDGDFTNAQDMNLVHACFSFMVLDRPVTAWVRDAVSRQWMWIVNRMQMWVRRTGGAAFKPLCPAPVVDRQDHLTALRTTYGDLRRKAETTRGERVRELANRRTEILEIAYMRNESIVSTGLAARRAITTIGDAPFVKFSVFDRVLALNGELAPGCQRCDWIAWRRPAAGGIPPRAPIDPAADGPLENSGAPFGSPGGDAGQPVPDLDGFLFEYLGCEPVIGDLAYDPWFVVICGNGVCVAPSRLDPAMQSRRHRLIVDWKLPSYPSNPEGLLRFGRDDSVLFRHMAAEGRILIPLFQFEGAMRFAHLGIRSIHESFCRSGEFRQQQYRRRMWPVDETGMHFLALRKMGDQTGREIGRARALLPGEEMREDLSHMDRFRVSEHLHNEAFALAELVIASCHRDTGRLPDMAPPVKFRHKCLPGPYLFSWNGRTLQLAHLLDFLGFLLGGIVNASRDGAIDRLQFHDFRHAEAKAAKFAGKCITMIQFDLKHSSEQTSETYTALTPEMIAVHAAEEIARRRAETLAQVYRLAA